MEHYRGKKTPFGLAHEKQKKPVQLGKKEYCEHFRPVLRAARNQSVYIPSLNLSGICEGISRHKDVSRQTMKVRTKNGEVSKVKRSLGFGIPPLGSFTQDTRTGNWYTVDHVDDDYIKIDAIMVRANNSVPTNAAPVNSVPTNAAPANSVPTNSVPTNAAPANSVPTNAAPANAAPANAAPANAAPGNAAPANAAPANAAPANATPPSGGTAASVAVAVAPPTAPPGKCI